LARRPISPTPNPPTATDRPAPSAEARPPAPEPLPAPQLAFAAGGSEGLHRELTETLRGADPRFRLVGTAGGQRSLNELLGPSGADLAVTSTVALGRAAPDAKARIAFVAKLFAEEIHVLARDGTGRLDDLDGKPVAVGPPAPRRRSRPATFSRRSGRSLSSSPPPGPRRWRGCAPGKLPPS